jgi:hypothetical protein
MTSLVGGGGYSYVTVRLGLLREAGSLVPIHAPHAGSARSTALPNPRKRVPPAAGEPYLPSHLEHDADENDP